MICLASQSARKFFRNFNGTLWWSVCPFLGTKHSSTRQNFLQPTVEFASERRSFWMVHYVYLYMQAQDGEQTSVHSISRIYICSRPTILENVICTLLEVFSFLRPNITSHCPSALWLHHLWWRVAHGNWPNASGSVLGTADDHYYGSDGMVAHDGHMIVNMEHVIEIDGW